MNVPITTSIQEKLLQLYPGWETESGRLPDGTRAEIEYLDQQFLLVMMDPSK